MPPLSLCWEVFSNTIKEHSFYHSSPSILKEMEKDEESSSPSYSAPFYMQTTEDDTATSVHSPRPSIIYSSKDESGDHLKKLQQYVSRIIKGLSSPPEVKMGQFNPEILTSQKRQWVNFHLQSLEERVWKEPTNLFESMVIVGLPPDSDTQALQNRYFSRKFEVPGKFGNSLNGQHQSRVEPNLEPQVLFVYPPEIPLPLKYKDLLSFCFPAGVEVNAVERTPSMSELNEILLGQEHQKQSDLSFVFRLQVADDSSLYGCCLLVEEIIQKPSGLISVVSDGSGHSRHILTTTRCYCILSRLPFFELHFAVLNSIFTEERLERLTNQMHNLDLVQHGHQDRVKTLEQKVEDLRVEASQSNHQNLNGEIHIKKESNGDVLPPDSITENLDSCRESMVDSSAEQCENPESSSSFHDSPCEDRQFTDNIHKEETEDVSSSGQDTLSNVIESAKANNHGSLRILRDYYQLLCPTRGSVIKFHPLDHLHPIEYYRPDETFLHIAGSRIDLRSCTTSLEFAEAHSALMVEEEASALSVWAVACLCGALRLEHILTLFTGALLEKQIIVVCSNLGILSALVLSIIPLIRPYQWQSLLMPILPNDMLDFLDAPVPYIVGVKNKTTEVQSKLTNVILIDANRNQVKASTLPQLPQHRELYSYLSPYHAKLVGESYLGKKRPVYDCNKVQVEAAKDFLGVLRTYLDSLCSNIRSHTITNVQSNDDKVSLLLKESFIDSFPSRDRPFMKLFLDTQMFSVHTDFVLSFFQKE